jgi:hypothetical protein
MYLRYMHPERESVIRLKPGNVHPYMPSRRLSLASLLSLALLLFALPSVAQAPSAQDGPLQANTDTPRVHLVANDDILRMAKAGLGDDVILQTIQLKPGHYDTAPDDLIALKTAGVSDRVIAAMEAHGTGLALRAGRFSVDPTPIAPGVDEIGVYYKAAHGENAGQWLPLQTERVVFKSGGAAKSILTHGIISKDMNGHIDGAKSPLQLPTDIQLLVYAPLGTDGNEYDFLRFEEHKDNREFRTLTGGVFHSESGAARDEIIFKPKKIAPQMYTFTVPVDIEKGEYGILPPGSANTQGLAGTGKIFTFSIIE